MALLGIAGLVCACSCFLASGFAAFGCKSSEAPKESASNPPPNVESPPSPEPCEGCDATLRAFEGAIVADLTGGVSTLARDGLSIGAGRTIRFHVKAAKGSNVAYRSTYPADCGVYSLEQYKSTGAPIWKDTAVNSTANTDPGGSVAGVANAPLDGVFLWELSATTACRVGFELALCPRGRTVTDCLSE